VPARVASRPARTIREILLVRALYFSSNDGPTDGSRAAAASCSDTGPAACPLATKEREKRANSRGGSVQCLERWSEAGWCSSYCGWQSTVSENDVDSLTDLTRMIAPNLFVREVEFSQVAQCSLTSLQRAPNCSVPLTWLFQFRRSSSRQQTADSDCSSREFHGKRIQHTEFSQYSNEQGRQESGRVHTVRRGGGGVGSTARKRTAESYKRPISRR
jgi:hypothetical protein